MGGTGWLTRSLQLVQLAPQVLQYPTISQLQSTLDLQCDMTMDLLYIDSKLRMITCHL